MAVYPIKMMKDESGQPFVPLTSLDAVIGEKNLQYILDAEELSAGHFRVNFKDLGMKDITNSIIVVRWPQITSTVKPSYLKLNNNTEAILYDGTGKEYMDLEDASGTINLLAYDGTKWIQATGSGSGGGHVITDGEGHSMEQQKVLSFVGFNVENDAANRATKIVNPTPINNLTTTESGQGSLDAYQGNILSKRSVPTGGTKGQVLAKSGNGDHQLEWINQDSDDVVTSDGSIEEIIGVTYEEYKALEAAGELKATTQYHITDFSEENMSFISEEEIQTMITSNVVNNLTTNSSTQALSAAKGQELNNSKQNVLEHGRIHADSFTEYTFGTDVSYCYYEYYFQQTYSDIPVVVCSTSNTLSRHFYGNIPAHVCEITKQKCVFILPVGKLDVYFNFIVLPV